MPEIAVGGELFVFVGGAELEEFEVGVVDEGLEVFVGGDGDVVAALLEADADADERVDVAVGAEGEKENVHGKRLSR